MAVTKIIPIRTTIDKSIDYICNPNKTENCAYIYSQNCFPQTASVEFEFYLRQARAGGNTIGRHLIQSFSPDETTAEQAHKIGKQLADEILKGEYAYVMSTHVDRHHIHNHFVWCAVNIKTHKKYHSNKNSYHKIQDISDRLCSENNLSIITEKSGRNGKDYYEYQQYSKGNSFKEKLRIDLDECIANSDDYNEVLKGMYHLKYDIKFGKHISFKHQDQERFTRAKTIGEEYTEHRIKERIKERLETPKSKLIPAKQEKKSVIAMLNTDKPKFQESKGLNHWAKTQNLKIASQTMILLEQKGLLNLEEFDKRVYDCDNAFSNIKNKMKATEQRIKTLTELKRQLQTYGKTKKSYEAFEQAKNQDKYLREHSHIESDVILHEAAKRFLNKYGKENKTNKLKMKVVNEELEKLQPILTKEYAQYNKIKIEQKELAILHMNLQKILNKDMKQSRGTQSR